MTVFFTSDPHVGHSLVARKRFERLYPDVTPLPTPTQLAHWHERRMRITWEETVGNDDVVWVLGDLCLGGRHQLDHALEFFSTLPGRKHLILGNHDKGHPRHRDADKWLDLYVPVFGVPVTAARRKVTMPDHTTREVVLSHFPYNGDRDEEDRDQQWRLRDMGSWLWHGHLHSESPMRLPDLTRMIDVGMDPWDMRPVSLGRLVEMMAEWEATYEVGMVSA